MDKPRVQVKTETPPDMSSSWRKFCCVCSRTEDQDYSSLKDKGSISVLNYKNRRKGRSKQKGTWTRRSLLVQEDFDYEGIVLEDKGYQMKMVNGPKEVGTNASNQNSQNHIRMSAMEVFAGVPRDMSVDQTTIPNWMDENFVPNGRTATHLGISSVQINSRRNEIIRRRSQDLTTQAFRYSTLNPGMSQSGSNASSILSTPNGVIHENTTKESSNGFQNNITQQSNFICQGNKTETKSKAVARPVSLTHVPRSGNLLHTEKQFHFRESQSDVGVRRIIPNTPGYRPGNPVPRLEDFTFGKMQSTQTPADQTDGYSLKYLNRQDQDVNYSNNITFKKSDVSLKSGNEPAVFSSISFDNKQYKQRLPIKSRSNPTAKPKPNDAQVVESMYGYVPKIVRNVHASTALEGNQIDDFFMQRMHDRELERFASISGESDAIQCGYVGSEKQARNIGKDHKVSDTVADICHEKDGSEHESSGFVIKTGTVKNIGTVDAIEIKDKSTRTEPPATASPARSPISNKGAGMETEEQVIMIDFPPNLENDKPMPFFNHIDLLQNDVPRNNDSNNSQQEPSQPPDNRITTDENQNEPVQLQSKPLTPIKTTIDRPRITMGITRTKAATRSDSDASRRSTQTTVSSILETAEVLY